jgi:hypothetical protein
MGRYKTNTSNQDKIPEKNIDYGEQMESFIRLFN